MYEYVLSSRDNRLLSKPYYRRGLQASNFRSEKDSYDYKSVQIEIKIGKKKYLIEIEKHISRLLLITDGHEIIAHPGDYNKIVIFKGDTKSYANYTTCFTHMSSSRYFTDQEYLDIPIGDSGYYYRLYGHECEPDFDTLSKII